MTPSDIVHLDHIQDKLIQAAGAAVLVEMRMRLIGEFSEPIQNIVKEACKKKKETKNEYWNCPLWCLDDAIKTIFYDKLESEDRQKLDSFRQRRNKCLHASFVELMELMNIDAEGQEILKTGKRNILEKSALKESIFSIERSQVLEKFSRQANAVIPILNKILAWLD